MKGTEKIIAHIEKDACTQAQTILDKAKEQAEAVAAEGKAKAQEKYWELVRVGTKDCEDLVARENRIAEMEAKKDILTLKQEKISAAFAKASEMIVAMPEADYVAFLAKKACEASSNGMEEIVFNARDKEAVGKAVAKKANEMLAAAGKLGKLTVAEDVKDMAGGLVVRQGGIEVNCSIEKLVEFCKNEMSSAVAATLFE